MIGWASVIKAVSNVLAWHLLTWTWLTRFQAGMVNTILWQTECSWQYC